MQKGDDTLEVRLAGAWRLRGGLPSAALVERELESVPSMQHIGFEARALTSWDSSVLAFLVEVSALCHIRGIDMDRTGLPSGLRRLLDLAEAVPALVGLKGFEDYYPSQISGGMQKRAGLARAMALDPEILFFDEPSAGLDPISSRLLDDLILELRDSLGSTVVVVTHELASIFTIGSNSVFLEHAGQFSMAQTRKWLLSKSHALPAMPKKDRPMIPWPL
jgi:ABC-type taurine transport system ATPase subunit